MTAIIMSGNRIRLIYDIAGNRQAYNVEYANKQFSEFMQKWLFAPDQARGDGCVVLTSSYCRALLSTYNVDKDIIDRYIKLAEEDGIEVHRPSPDSDKIAFYHREAEDALMGTGDNISADDAARIIISEVGEVNVLVKQYGELLKKYPAGVDRILKFIDMVKNNLERARAPQ